MPGLKSAAITRAGFEYQDLIGIQQLIDFFRNRNKYYWMQLESEDANMGYLDDIVAALSDGTFDLTQVKFTADANAYFLNWDWLLAKRPRGTSLLRKWSSSVNGFSLGRINVACLKTNRVPDAGFAATLKADGRVNFDKIDARRRAAIEAEIGNAALARKFFKQFQFLHSQPMLEELADDLRSSIVPTDTDIIGWLTLVAQAKNWAMRKNSPKPDGRITHKHLTQIITRKAPRPIPQDFAVPLGYEVPSAAFHDAFLKRVSTGQTISVLWGTPGRGKSTYLSFLTDKLRKTDIPVVRHHYFLSLDDTTTDRFSFPDIAQSLMDQIVAHYPDAVKGMGLTEEANQLPKWLEKCGEYFVSQGTPFIVVIDGLDHVWRERRNIDQLNYLFENLLPAAPNVSIIVGTQKVANDKLPTRLLKKITKKDWIEIPAMDEFSVQSWIKQQYAAKRLRLRKSGFGGTVALELGKIGTAFFKISAGHPLHLIYSFETLVKGGGCIDAEEVSLLPACPDGDINNYYQLLWTKLPDTARDIMHLIAGSDFCWPFDGIVKNFGQLDGIGFLLEHRRIGLVPFHGSILAFVREMPEHKPRFLALLPRVLKWLTKDAPSYLRWGWLWLMKAKAGDAKPLLKEATRQWVINSMQAGWPLTQMLTILSEAETIAFNDGDYPRTIELRSLKTRISNAEEFQLNSFDRLTECAIISSKNTQVIEVIADGLTTLAEKSILSLCRVASALKPDVCEEARRELGHRINLWLSLRHRPDAEFVALTKLFLEAASLAQKIDAPRTVNFIEGFRDGDPVFEHLLECLVRAGRVAAFPAIYKAIRRKNVLERKKDTIDAYMRASSACAVDIRPELRALKFSEASAFGSSWLHYKKARIAVSVTKPLRPTALEDKNPEYRRNITAENYLYQVFFYELSKGLREPKSIKASYPISGAFIDGAINMLVDCARNIASGASQLSFATVYFAANAIAPVDDRNFHDPEHSQYFGLKHALRRIATDLHLIKQPVGAFSSLTDEELNIGRASRHWVEELWLDVQLDRNLTVMSKEQAAKSLAKEISYLDLHVTQFGERGDKWVLLARFALLYGLPELAALVRRATDCSIAYGWRKDLWMMDILDSIAEVNQVGAANGLQMLRQVVPLVDQITNFTDGDETDHVRGELIETTARIAPSRLPNFYAHHLEEDEFRYAEGALEQLIKASDFNSPVTQALGHTFIEDNDMAVLTEIAKTTVKAKLVLDDQVAFVGGAPPKRKDYGSTPTPQTKTKRPPKVDKYGPDEFAKLVKRIHSPGYAYDVERLSVRQWLDHWVEKGQAAAALASMKAFIEAENSTYGADTLFDHAFEVSRAAEGKHAAFYWLVKAHIHRHGWQSNWTSKKEVMARLTLAATLYKDDWQKFIHETSVQEAYWKRRNRSFVIGHKYLVRFLLMVDQKKLAADITRAMIKTVLSEVSDQPIPVTQWFN